MKKEKILLVHNKYQISGGEDSVVRNEKELLQKNGHEVICYIRNNNELKSMNIFQKLLIPLTTIFNLKTYQDVRKIIRTENIEIVHVHNTLSLISPSVYYAANKERIPIVQTLHNFRFLCPNATFYRNHHICEDCISSGLGQSIKHKCYRNSRIQTAVSAFNLWIHRKTGILKKVNFICLTNFNKDKFLNINQNKKVVEASNIYVKPNFTFLKPIASRDDKTILKKVPSEFFLCVGRLEEIKGIKYIIDAFAELPNKTIVFAGPGKENYEKQCTQRNLKNIIFLDLLPQSDIGILMDHALALICASQTYEGFPMTFVEAYSHGLPIISVNMGNAGDLVIENKTGLHYQFDSSEDLKDKILQFSKIPNINYLKSNAKELFNKKYLETKNYEKLYCIYKSILKKNNI